MEVTCTTFFLIALANFLNILVLESVHMANRFACVASVLIAFLIASTIYFSINRRNDPLLDRALGVDTKQYVSIPDFQFRVIFSKPMKELKDAKESAPIYYIGVFILLIQSFLLVFITLRQDERGPSTVILLIAAIVHFFEPTSLKNFKDPQTWAGVATSFYDKDDGNDRHKIEKLAQLFFRLYMAMCIYSIIIAKFVTLFGADIGEVSPYKHCLIVCILFCSGVPLFLVFWHWVKKEKEDICDAIARTLLHVLLTLAVLFLLYVAIPYSSERYVNNYVKQAQTLIAVIVFVVFLIIFKLNAVVFDKYTS